jgi:hypothetical protein
MCVTTITETKCTPTVSLMIVRNKNSVCMRVSLRVVLVLRENNNCIKNYSKLELVCVECAQHKSCLVAIPARSLRVTVTPATVVTCSKFKFWLEIIEFWCEKCIMYICIHVYIYLCMHVYGYKHMQVFVCACS